VLVGEVTMLCETGPSALGAELGRDRSFWEACGERRGRCCGVGELLARAAGESEQASACAVVRSPSTPIRHDSHPTPVPFPPSSKSGSDVASRELARSHGCALMPP